MLNWNKNKAANTEETCVKLPVIQYIYIYIGGERKKREIDADDIDV